MASAASGLASTRAGLSQTRRMPRERMMRDWPTRCEPSASSALRLRATGAAGTTWPRTARTRLAWRTPSSKSPVMSTMAAMSRLPKAWPASPGSPSVAGKRYCMRLFMVGSASARAAMQLRMSPTGGTPELLAELARRAAVVRDRDDGRDVAADLLEAAQQRGEAGPAADGHDARAARQRTLLVDELDERLAANRERLQEHRQQAPQAEAEDSHADGDDRQRPQGAGQEVQADDLEELARQAVRGHLAKGDADGQRAGRGQDGEAQEHHQQPALDAGARPQPAAQACPAALCPPRRHRRFSSSRCQTITGPMCRSASWAASASPMATERWKPPVQPMAMVRRVLPSAR